MIPELSYTPPLTSHLRAGYWRQGLRLSAAVHLAALGLMAAELVWIVFPVPPAPPSTVVELRAEFAAAGEISPTLDTFPEPDEPAPQPVAAPKPPAAAETINIAAEPATGRAVQEQVQAAIREAQQLPAEDQLARLESLTGKLNDVASEESVDELAGKFQKLLGTEERAAAPVADAAGDFDFETAQLHDVRREAAPDGSYSYTSILVDAAGRQMETPLNAADGESLYRVMELIKANPLLERLYRGVVMSLLDKLAKPM